MSSKTSRTLIPIRLGSSQACDGPPTDPQSTNRNNNDNMYPQVPQSLPHVKLPHNRTITSLRATATDHKEQRRGGKELVLEKSDAVKRGSEWFSHINTPHGRTTSIENKIMTFHITLSDTEHRYFPAKARLHPPPEQTQLQVDHFLLFTCTQSSPVSHSVEAGTGVGITATPINRRNYSCLLGPATNT